MSDLISETAKYEQRYGGTVPSEQSQQTQSEETAKYANRYGDTQITESQKYENYYSASQPTAPAAGQAWQLPSDAGGGYNGGGSPPVNGSFDTQPPSPGPNNDALDAARASQAKKMEDFLAARAETKALAQQLYDQATADVEAAEGNVDQKRMDALMAFNALRQIETEEAKENIAAGGGSGSTAQAQNAVQPGSSTTTPKFLGKLRKNGSKSANKDLPLRTEAQQRHVDSDAKERLHLFYSYYNPDQIGNIDTILAAYRGDEVQMFADLARIYDSVPLPEARQAQFEQELAALGPLPPTYYGRDQNSQTPGADESSHATSHGSSNNNQNRDINVGNIFNENKVLQNQHLHKQQQQQQQGGQQQQQQANPSDDYYQTNKFASLHNEYRPERLIQEDKERKQKQLQIMRQHGVDFVDQQQQNAIVSSTNNQNKNNNSNKLATLGITVGLRDQNPYDGEDDDDDDDDQENAGNINKNRNLKDWGNIDAGNEHFFGIPRISEFAHQKYKDRPARTSRQVQQELYEKGEAQRKKKEAAYLKHQEDLMQKQVKEAGNGGDGQKRFSPDLGNRGNMVSRQVDVNMHAIKNNKNIQKNNTATSSLPLPPPPPKPVNNIFESNPDDPRVQRLMQLMRDGMIDVQEAKAIQGQIKQNNNNSAAAGAADGAEKAGQLEAMFQQLQRQGSGLEGGNQGQGGSASGALQTPAVPAPLGLGTPSAPPPMPTINDYKQSLLEQDLAKMQQHQQFPSAGGQTNNKTKSKNNTNTNTNIPPAPQPMQMPYFTKSYKYTNSNNNNKMPQQQQQQPHQPPASTQQHQQQVIVNKVQGAHNVTNGQIEWAKQQRNAALHRLDEQRRQQQQSLKQGGGGGGYDEDLDAVDIIYAQSGAGGSNGGQGVHKVDEFDEVIKNKLRMDEMSVDMAGNALQRQLKQQKYQQQIQMQQQEFYSGVGGSGSQPPGGSAATVVTSGGGGATIDGAVYGKVKQPQSQNSELSAEQKEQQQQQVRPKKSAVEDYFNGIYNMVDQSNTNNMSASEQFARRSQSQQSTTAGGGGGRSQSTWSVGTGLHEHATFNNFAAGFTGESQMQSQVGGGQHDIVFVDSDED